MSDREPAAIRALWDAIHEALPRAQLSGIVGNPASHFYGYHRSRNWDVQFGSEGAGDYSCVLPQDKLGKGDCASALDVTLPADLMVEVSKRLLAAGKANDQRLAAMREFFGTVDGQRVIGWDRHNPDNAHDDTPTSSDPSHLWHVHLSFYRLFADDFAALAPIADVFTSVHTEEEDMPITDDDAHKVAVAVRQADIGNETIASALRKILAAVADQDGLADAIVAKIKAGVPAQSGGLTRADVKAALREVFTDAGTA